MIKNIYDKNKKGYEHEYYCDECFIQIKYGDILRSEKAIEYDKFDLCSKCKKYWDEIKKV